MQSAIAWFICAVNIFQLSNPCANRIEQRNMCLENTSNGIGGMKTDKNNNLGLPRTEGGCILHTFEFY